ncbi:MAG: flagellar hook-basal body complex protein FliE [Pseudomonadota bacterium]
MDVNAKNAAQLYSAARDLVKDAGAANKTKAEPQESFSETLSKAATETVNSLNQAEQTATAGMTGAADPQSVVEAMLEAEMAIETAVTVRDKVVEAYQEILRMPV